MKVLEKAENVCLASMLTPRLTERKYFNLRGLNLVSCNSLGGTQSVSSMRCGSTKAEPGAKRSRSDRVRVECHKQSEGWTALECSSTWTRSLRCASLPVLLCGRCAPPTYRHFKITRLSPALRVTRSRSKYSNNGIAYFREMPARSLKVGTSINRSGSFDAAYS